MQPCPHCGADVGDASPAYCPTCRGPLLGQRRDVAPPLPGVEFDRAAEIANPFDPVDGDPFGDDEGYPRAEHQGEDQPLTTFELPQPADAPMSRGFAIKNILRGGFLLLILGPLVWGFVDGAINGADRDDSGSVVKAGDLEVTELEVGDCFDLPAGSENDVEVLEVEAIPCSEAHDNEVYVVTNYVAGEDYPGELAIWDFADDFCLTAFDTFVGLAYEDSLLDFGYFYPSPEGWSEGDQEIACVLYDINGAPLTGSMRGAAR